MIKRSITIITTITITCRHMDCYFAGCNVNYVNYLRLNWDESNNYIDIFSITILCINSVLFYIFQTLGGIVMTNSSFSDILPILMASEAKLVIASTGNISTYSDQWYPFI